MNTHLFSNRFNSFSDFLRGFAYKLTRDIHQAEDLFQETAYLAFKNQHKFRRDTNMKAWLSTIMKNKFINGFRRKRKYHQIMDGTPEHYHINQTAEVVTNDAEHKLNAEILTVVVDELEDHLKIPFLMHFQGYKYDEIGQKMELPMGTIKSRIFHARTKLKKKLKNLYPDYTEE